MKDNYPKYLLTPDYILQRRNGICHDNLMDFMLMTKVYYQAWLTAWYACAIKRGENGNPAPKPEQTQNDASPSPEMAMF